MTLAIRLVLALAATFFPWPSTPWFPYAPGKPRPLMTLSNPTGTWTGTVNNTTFGFPASGSFGGGSVVKTDDLAYGVDDTFGPYVSNQGVTANSRIRWASAANIQAWLEGTSGRYALIRSAVSFHGVGDFDFTDGSSIGNNPLVGDFYTNPDARWTVPSTESWDGDSDADWVNRPSGRHITITAVNTQDTYEGPPHFGNRVFVEVGKIVHIDQLFVCTAEDTFTIMWLLDGVPFMVAEGIDILDLPDYTDTHRCDLMWYGMGNDSDEQWVEMRLYKNYSGVRSGTTGLDGYVYRAEPDFYRATETRHLASGAIGGIMADWEETLSGATLDLSQDSDLYGFQGSVHSRGYNTYPIRIDSNSTSDTWKLESRETNLSWPTRGGICVLAAMVLPSNSDGEAMSFRCLAENGSDPYVGFGWDRTANGDLDLDFVDVDGFERTEDSGINLSSEKPYLIIMTFEAGEYAKLTVFTLSEISDTDQVMVAQSTNIYGIPSDGFRLRCSGADGGVGSTAGQCQVFSVGVYERWPVHMLSSFASTNSTGNDGDDNGINARIPAHICKAGAHVSGPSGFISLHDTIGRLDSDGLPYAPPNGPGFYMGRSGLSIKVFNDSWLDGDPSAYAPFFRGLLLWEADLKVNAVGGGGLTAAETYAEIVKLVSAMTNAGVDIVTGKTPHPPATTNGTTYTQASIDEYILVNAQMPGLPGPRWQFNIVDPKGSESAASEYYMYDPDENNQHPWRDYPFILDQQDTLEYIPGGTRKRDRTRER
jgi:hypothetical protein